MTSARNTVDGAYSSTIPKNAPLEDFSPTPSRSLSTTIPSDEVSVGFVPGQPVSEDRIIEERLIKQSKELVSIGAHKDTVLETYNKLARHYLGCDDLEKAESTLARALEFARLMYGEKDPTVALILTELAFVNYKSGNYENARDYLLPALAIQEEEYGKVSEQSAFVVHKLGRVYEALGDLELAEAFYLRSVTSYQNTYIEDDSQMIIARGDLARVRRCRK